MFKHALLVFLGASSYGVLTTFVKKAYEANYSVGDVTGSQVFIGMIILWILYFFQVIFQSKSLEKYKQSTLKNAQTPFYKLILLGTSFGMVSLTYYQSVQYLDASLAIILLMQFVWISMLLEWIFYAKRPRNAEFIAAFIIIIGTILASGALDIDMSKLPLKGILYALLAAFFYALSIMINSKIGTDFAPIKKSALMLTGSTCLIFLIYTPHFLIDGYLFHGLLKWALVLAIFGTVIPPMFFAIGMPKIGMSMGSILSSAELPVAVISSTIFLGEYISLLQCVGIIVILLAIVFANFGEKWFYLTKSNKN